MLSWLQPIILVTLSVVFTVLAWQVFKVVCEEIYYDFKEIIHTWKEK